MRVIPILLALTTTAVIAQQPGTMPPDARPPVTPAQRAVAEVPLNPTLPTLFIVGDSTARNNADLGWGDHLVHYFDTAKINVANRARAGRSARTYLNEGMWAKTLAEMKPGDTLLLQMGHNDGGDLGGAKPRGDLKGIGPETKDVPQTAGPLAGTTETVHTYGWYVRKFIDEAKAKGVKPMLLTLTIRNVWKDATWATARTSISSPRRSTSL
jgi:rhamnogalacturonan acetylesterase